MTEPEPLGGGLRTAHVVRVGDTVRRSRSASSDRSAAILRALEDVGYPYSPRYLGVDEDGFDILSFIPGTTTDHPEQRSERSYAAGGAMLRALHDSSAGADVLGRIGTIVHGDAGPFNTVFRDGMPVAFIDWDSAGIGDPVEDCAYAAWTWCVQAVGGVPVSAQAEHLRQFRNGYGRDPERDLVGAVIDRQGRLIDQVEEELGDSSLSAGERAVRLRALEWAQSDRSVILRNLSTFTAALA